MRDSRQPETVAADAAHFYRDITHVRWRHRSELTAPVQLQHLAPLAIEGEMPEGLRLIDSSEQPEGLGYKLAFGELGLIWRDRDLVLAFDHEDDARDYWWGVRRFLSRAAMDRYAAACRVVEARGGKVNPRSVAQAISLPEVAPEVDRYFDWVHGVSAVVDLSGLSGVQLNLTTLGTLVLPDLPGDVPTLYPYRWAQWTSEAVAQEADRRGELFGIKQLGIRMDIDGYRVAASNGTDLARWVAAAIVALNDSVKAQYDQYFKETLPGFKRHQNFLSAAVHAHLKRSALPRGLLGQAAELTARAEQAKRDFPDGLPFVSVVNADMPYFECLAWRLQERSKGKGFYDYLIHQGHPPMGGWA